MHTRRIVFGAVALALTACGSDASAEARMFLDRVEQLDADAPAEERRRRLDNLEHLPLSDDAVRSARTECVDAHRSILDAEEVQTRVASELAGYAPDAQLSPEVTRRLDAELARARRATDRASTLLTRCEDAQRRLRLRYARRRS